MKNKMVTIKHEKHLLWARHCADFKCIISCNLHKNSMEVINQVHILTIIFLLTHIISFKFEKIENKKTSKKLIKKYIICILLKCSLAQVKHCSYIHKEFLNNYFIFFSLHVSFE